MSNRALHWTAETALYSSLLVLFGVVAAIMWPLLLCRRGYDWIRGDR